MRLTKRIVWDADFNVLEHEWEEYEGVWYLLKGENTQGMSASSQQLAMQNALTQQQLALAQKFQGPVLEGLQKYLTGDVGFSPEQKALLDSQFLNQQSQKFNQAGQQVRSALASRGAGAGDLPVGGDYVRGIGTLEGLRGATTSAGLRDINLADIQQALTNKFNTAGIFTGNAGINIGAGTGFQNAASASLGDYVKASTPQPSPLYGVLGAGLSAAGQAASGPMGCPSADAMILMADASEKKASELKQGDKVQGVDGGEDVVMYQAVCPSECLEVEMDSGVKVVVSQSHTFARPGGGYCFAEKAEAQFIKTLDGRALVIGVQAIGERDVVRILLDRSHSYCADGVFGLE